VGGGEYYHHRDIKDKSTIINRRGWEYYHQMANSQRLLRVRKLILIPKSAILISCQTNSTSDTNNTVSTESKFAKAFASWGGEASEATEGSRASGGWVCV